MKTTFPHDDDDEYWNEALAGAINWDAIVPPEIHQSIVEQTMGPLQNTIDSMLKQASGSLVEDSRFRRSYLDLAKMPNLAGIIGDHTFGIYDFDGVHRPYTGLGIEGALESARRSAMQTVSVGETARRLFEQLSPDMSERLMGGAFSSGSAWGTLGAVSSNVRDLTKWAGASSSWSLVEEVAAGARAVKISAMMTDQLQMPESVLSSLAAKLDTWAPKTLSAALQIAETEPEVFEAAKQAVEAHPDEVAEIASTLTGQDSPRPRGITSQQAVKLTKEMTVALGVIFGATLSSPVIAVVAAILVFSLAVVEMDMEDQRVIPEGSGD